MIRSPLNPKRDTPRRNAGRIQHTRTKPKASAAPTAAEKRHMERVVGLGCILTDQPAEVHHIMKAPGKARRRDHRWIVPLSPEMHRGQNGVHYLGSEALFEQTHNLPAGYLIAWAEAAWKESCGE